MLKISVVFALVLIASVSSNDISGAHYGKKSQRVNLLSQALGARGQSSAMSLQQPFDPSQNGMGNGFVPIPRSNPTQMMQGTQGIQGGMQGFQGGMQTIQGGMQTAQGGMQTAQGGMQTAQGGMQGFQGVQGSAEVITLPPQIPQQQQVQQPQQQLFSGGFVQTPTTTTTTTVAPVAGQMQMTQEQLRALLSQFPNLPNLIPNFNQQFGSMMTGQQFVPQVPTTTTTTTTTTTVPTTTTTTTTPTTTTTTTMFVPPQVRPVELPRTQITQQTGMQQMMQFQQPGMQQMMQFPQQQQQPGVMPQIPTFPVQQQVPTVPVQPQVPVMPALPTGSVDFCRNSQAGDLIAHPNNQNEFIICYGFGEFTIMSCPEHLVYNPHLQRCDNDATVPVGCASNPCLNNGKCTDMPNFRYVCECPVGFTGRHCERSDACSTNPCGFNGTCLSMAPGGPLTHVCFCQGGRVLGQTCSTNTEANPCMQPNSNMKIFPSRLSQSMFIHCEGVKPHLKFCLPPLIFNAQKSACDWS